MKLEICVGVSVPVIGRELHVEHLSCNAVIVEVLQLREKHIEFGAAGISTISCWINSDVRLGSVPPQVNIVIRYPVVLTEWHQCTRLLPLQEQTRCGRAHSQSSVYVRRKL